MATNTPHSVHVASNGTTAVDLITGDSNVQLIKNFTAYNPDSDAHTVTLRIWIDSAVFNITDAVLTKSATFVWEEGTTIEGSVQKLQAVLGDTTAAEMSFHVLYATHAEAV
jgi:hypothetical protein